MPACRECGAETGAEWKALCLTCWKKAKGIPVRAAPRKSTRTPKQHGKPGQFAVWMLHDPRVMGDNYAEVYNVVVFIGDKYDAEDYWERMCRANRHFPRTDSYKPPVAIKEGEEIWVGQKRTIHGGRTKISAAERWETDHGY